MRSGLHEQMVTWQALPPWQEAGVNSTSASLLSTVTDEAAPLTTAGVSGYHAYKLIVDVLIVGTLCVGGCVGNAVSIG